MPDQIDLLNTLLQAYQGQADTAGPYFNLASIFQPGYGQLGLTNQQQQMFGYNVGPGGGIGTPSTPYGGFFGAPQQSYAPQAPSGSGTYSPGGFLNGSNYSVSSTSPASPYQVTSGTGGIPGQTYTPASPSSPAGSPYGVGSGTGGVPGQGGVSLFSPDQGTRIGLGHTFDNPYGSQFGPAQASGYHPGVLDLNTTALNSYGPLATGSLLNANPYLASSLGFQQLALSDASNPLQNSPLLNALNTQANQGLAQGGRLSAQDERSASQSALGYLSNAGASTTGNTGIAAQLLNRDQLVNSRELQAQQLAQQVQGLNFSQQAQELQRQQLAGNLAYQGVSSATSGLTNPLLQVLGLGSLNATSSPSTSISDQGQLTNPFLQAGLDVAGANFNAQVAQNIANQNQNAATTSGLLSLGGGILSAFSDKRIKKNVKKVGESESGIPEYEWVYPTDPYKRTFHGTTAQALEKIKPEAVLTDPYSGLKAVDYSQIDVEFREVDPYARKAA